MPLTAGRWGCVEGNRRRLICGERMSEGSGELRRFGRLSWRILMAATQLLAAQLYIEPR